MKIYPNITMKYQLTKEMRYEWSGCHVSEFEELEIYDVFISEILFTVHGCPLSPDCQLPIFHYIREHAYLLASTHFHLRKPFIYKIPETVDTILYERIDETVYITPSYRNCRVWVGYNELQECIITFIRSAVAKILSEMSTLEDHKQFQDLNQMLHRNGVYN